MQARQQLRPSEAALACVVSAQTVLATYPKASNRASRSLDSQYVNGASCPLSSQLWMGASRPMNWPAGLALSESALNRMCQSLATKEKPQEASAVLPGPRSVPQHSVYTVQLRASARALPNPSLKRSANGRPPAPGRWYAVHFYRPGAGVLPLSPA